MAFGVTQVVEVLSHRRALKFIIATIVAGTVIMVIGLAIGISVGNILHAKVEDSLIISGYSDIEDDIKTEIDSDSSYTTFSVYFFNITNVEEVMDGGIPNLQECGPYVFRKYSLTMSASFNEDNTELYRTFRTEYIYDPEASTANPFTDSVTLASSYYMGILANFGSEMNLMVYAGSSAFDSIVQSLTGQLFPWLVITTTGTVFLQTTKTSVASVISLPTFYTIWANYTTAPPGYPAHFIVSSAGVPSGISATTAALLWDCSSTLSFCNSAGVQTWAYAANGVTAYQQQLISSTGLSSTQLTLVLSWLGSYWNSVVSPYLLNKYDISTIYDLGYVQWGNGTCFGTVSVSDLEDMPIPIEVSLWALRELGIDFSLTVTQSKALLTGTYALTDVTQLGTFLTLAQTADSASFQTIYNIWGLDPTSALVVASYFYSGIMGTLVAQPISEILYSGGGFFSSRTAAEWLFAVSDESGTPYPDPLASYLFGSNIFLKLFRNDTTVAGAVLVNHSTLVNTGKDDLRQIYNTYEYDGTSTLDIWALPVKVEGTDGSSFQPFRTSPKTFVPKMWSSDFQRRLDWTFAKEYHLKGIKLYRYELADYMLAANTTFYMSFPNFANMTSDTGGVPMFISTPHFLDCPEWRENVTGLNPDESVHRAYLGMDSYTGLVLDAYKALQSNVFVDGNWKEGLSYFYPNLRSNMMLPIFWAIELGQISDEDAKDFKNTVVHTEAMSQQILLACVIAGTLILVSGLTVLAVWLANRTNAASSKVTPIEGETLITTTIAEPTQQPTDDTGSGPTKITVEPDTF